LTVFSSVVDGAGGARVRLGEESLSTTSGIVDSWRQYKKLRFIEIIGVLLLCITKSLFIFAFGKERPPFGRSYAPSIQKEPMNIAGKNINIFGESDKAAPVVYLHTFQHEGLTVWEECRKLGTKRFVLVEIDGVDWNADMSPWPIEKLFAGDTACTGGAEAWLNVLTAEIIPCVEDGLTVARRMIAGYSLAGLFALWSAYRTDVFDGIISGSGSFWYPGFMDFASRNSLLTTPVSIYLSLGDRESHVKNPILQTVEDNTRRLCDHYLGLDIPATFELNTGNHYMQTERRVAKGIQWSLKQSSEQGLER
jgi:hypothetical protein